MSPDGAQASPQVRTVIDELGVDCLRAYRDSENSSAPELSALPQKSPVVDIEPKWPHIFYGGNFQ